MLSFLVVPVLLCAAVLIVSGAAKVSDPTATRDAFTALRLPRTLAASPAPVLLPWAEIALGVVLLLARGWLLGLAAAATAALFVAYLVVVVRALGFDEPVNCHCFGTLGEATLSRRTVVRNGVLVATAVLAILAALGGVSVPGAVAASPAATLGWVAMAALAGAVALLVLGRGPDAAGAGPSLEGPTVPSFTLVEAASGTPVHSWNLPEGPTLLLFLSRGCGPCERVAADLDDWVAAAPGVRFRAVVNDAASDALQGWGGESLARDALLDPRGNVLAIHRLGTPTGLLVGPHGALLRPVLVGEDTLRALVSELSGAPDADRPGGVGRDGHADEVVLGSGTADPTPTTAADQVPDEDDFERSPIPAALVLDGAQPLTLQELGAQKAQLLVSVTCLCGGSSQAIDQVAGWQERLPLLDVSLLSSMPADELPLPRTGAARVLYDHAGLAQRALGMPGSPQAILLGADVLIAGGPVTGLAEIEEFVGDIEAQLAEAVEPAEG